MHIYIYMHTHIGTTHIYIYIIYIFIGAVSVSDLSFCMFFIIYGNMGWGTLSSTPLDWHPVRVRVRFGSPGAVSAKTCVGYSPLPLQPSWPFAFPLRNHVFLFRLDQFCVHLLLWLLWFPFGFYDSNDFYDSYDSYHSYDQ